MGRAGGPVPRARPARVPERPRRDRDRGHAARARHRVRRAARRRAPVDAVRRLLDRREDDPRRRGPARRGARRARHVPVIAGVEGSGELFNIVFFAVLISTVLQGTSFEPLAERLGVTTREPALPRPLAEAGTIRALGAEVLEFPIGAADAIAGARVRDLALPREAVVNVIVRGDEAIPPRGSTRLLAGDELHLLVRAETAGEVTKLMRRWREGPIGPAP